MPKKKCTETQVTKVQETSSATQTTAADEANLLSAPVVTMREYDPYDRPVAAEGADTSPVSPVRASSYEEVLESARGPGSTEWKQADRERRYLGELYRTLEQDERYSDAHKSETAWHRYEAAKKKVEGLASAAKEKMLGSARTSERLSIPVVPEEPLSTRDVGKLTLTDNARARLERLLDRAEKGGGNSPFKRDPVDILKAEYERALVEGGPAGGARVRAVVSLAEDYGLDLNKIVDEHRQQRHRNYLEDADQIRMHAQLVSSWLPKPPFKHPSQLAEKEKPGTYGSRQKRVISPEGKLAFKKPRRRAW